MKRVLSEDEFVDALRVEFVEEFAPERIHLGARLLADLEMDSLELIRLAAFVESLAPIDLPEDLDLADFTIGDVFYYYDLLARRALSNTE